MENNKLKIIKDLMEQLQEQMVPGKEDFEERLGRKPAVKITEIEVSKPKGKMLEEDMDKEEMEEDEESVMEPMSPEMESDEDSLKERLMKLRSK